MTTLPTPQDEMLRKLQPESMMEEVVRLRKENSDLRFFLKQIAARNCHDPVAFAQARLNYPDTE